MSVYGSSELGVDYLKYPSVVAKLDEFRSHDGYQIALGNDHYAVGQICLDHRLAWERAINARPDSNTWKVLFLNGLAQHENAEISVVVGAPFSQIDADFIASIPKGEITLRMPNGKSRRKTISEVRVLPECAAHALAFREAYKGSALVMSLGFGTVELGAAEIKGGVIPESLHSITYGLHHCAPKLRAELKKLGYDPTHIRDNQYHYFDELLKQIVEGDEELVLRREGKEPLEVSDLAPIAERVLTEYATGLIQQLAKYLSNFDRKMPIILTGGGTMYKTLVKKLKVYLESQKYEVKLADEELSILSAAIGYHIVAKELFGASGVGIDVGNNTVITILKRSEK